MTNIEISCEHTKPEEMGTKQKIRRSHFDCSQIYPYIFLLEKVLFAAASGVALLHPSAPTKSHRTRTSPALLTFCKSRQHVKVILFYLFDFIFPVSYQAALKSLQDFKQ